MDSKAPSARAVAQKLLDLCSDPENQLFISQQPGFLGGLVDYLDYQDNETVRISIRALKHLSTHPKVRKNLTTHPGLLHKLKKLRNHTDEKIQVLADQTLGNITLRPKAAGGTGSQGKAISQTQKGPAVARALVMKVEGIQDEGIRRQVERSLISIRGVVSVTLDQKTERAIIYTRSHENLVGAITNAIQGIDLSNRDSLTSQKKSNEPKYLDDDDDEIFGPQGANVVSKVGNSTLDERLEEKRREGRNPNKSSRLIARVGRGLSNVLSFW